jgi:tetratricopeptide (TPR) repeat protein
MDQEKHPSDLVAWQAVLAYQVGAFDKSINLWRKAAEGFLDSGVIWRSAECECNIAVLFTTLGQFDQAIEQYEQAKTLYNRIGDSKLAFQCDRDIGNCLVWLGKSALALEYFRQARAAFQRLHLEEEVLGCDIGIGAALHGMARFQDALEKYRGAVALSMRLGNHESTAQCEDNIGIVLREIGLPEQALEHHQRAMQIFQNIGSHKDAALCAMNIGSTLDVLGQLSEAMRFFERARTGFLVLGLKKEAADCDVNLGAMLLNHKQPDLALGSLERARSLLEGLGLVREVAGCDMNIGSALRDIGKIDAAMERYSSAKRINMNLGLEFETAMCDLAIGVCLEMEAEGVADSQIPYVNALSNLEAGLDVLERFRADVSFIEHRISFFQQYTRFYETAALCCIRLGRMAEALQYLERCRSRVLSEAIATNLLPDPEEIGEELYAQFIRTRGYIRELGLIPLYGVRDKTDIQTINLPAEASVFSQAQNEFHELVGRIVEEYPDSSFARRLNSTEVRYLKEAREYVDLLPDNCSGLLEFMTWGPDGRLRAFFVTRQRGIELLTFSEHSLTSLNAVLRRWLKLYDNSSNTDDKAHVVWRTCRELHDLIFGAAIEISGDAARDEGASRGCKTLLDYIDEVLERSAQEQLRRIYIVPDSFLALLPLHAACRDQENQAKSAGKATQGFRIGNRIISWKIT